MVNFKNLLIGKKANQKISMFPDATWEKAVTKNVIVLTLLTLIGLTFLVVAQLEGEFLKGGYGLNE